MQKSLLIEILSAFNKKEWRDLEKWLHSPIHNQREDVRLLFDYIREHKDDFKQIEKETAWKRVFKKEEYHDARMRQVIYFLTASTQDYISYAQMQEDSLAQQLTLARFFRLRQLEKPFNTITKAFRRKLEAQPLRNQLYSDYLYRLERETFDFKATQRQTDSLHLQETGEALDLSFIATKLRIGCAMLSHQSVNRKVSYDEGLLPFLLHYIEEKNLESHPSIAGFYYGYMLSTKQVGVEYFENLTYFIEHHHSTMSLEELRELYRMALNFCIHQVNTGKQDFAESALGLYKNGIEQGALLENGKVPRFTFFNTIGMALKVKAFDWAEDFIKRNEVKLSSKHKNSSVQFNLARIFFEKKDYDQAQKLLIHYEYDDLLINLLAKTMLLKIYFEEGELDALESLIGSMGAYLKRKESLDDNRRIGYKNFLKIIKKIINLSPSAKTARSKIRVLIEETQPLMERTWLKDVLK